MKCELQTLNAEHSTLNEEERAMAEPLQEPAKTEQAKWHAMAFFVRERHAGGR